MSVSKQDFGCKERGVETEKGGTARRKVNPLIVWNFLAQQAHGNPELYKPLASQFGWNPAAPPPQDSSVLKNMLDALVKANAFESVAKILRSAYAWSQQVGSRNHPVGLESRIGGACGISSVSDSQRMPQKGTLRERETDSQHGPTQPSSLNQRPRAEQFFPPISTANIGALKGALDVLAAKGISANQIEQLIHSLRKQGFLSNESDLAQLGLLLGNSMKTQKIEMMPDPRVAMDGRGVQSSRDYGGYMENQAGIHLRSGGFQLPSVTLPVFQAPDGNRRRRGYAETMSLTSATPGNSSCPTNSIFSSLRTKLPVMEKAPAVDEPLMKLQMPPNLTSPDFFFRLKLQYLLTFASVQYGGYYGVKDPREWWTRLCEKFFKRLRLIIHNLDDLYSQSVSGSAVLSKERAESLKLELHMEPVVQHFLWKDLAERELRRIGLIADKKRRKEPIQNRVQKRDRTDGRTSRSDVGEYCEVTESSPCKSEDIDIPAMDHEQALHHAREHIEVTLVQRQCLGQASANHLLWFFLFSQRAEKLFPTQFRLKVLRLISAHSFDYEASTTMAKRSGSPDARTSYSPIIHNLSF